MLATLRKRCAQADDLALELDSIDNAHECDPTHTIEETGWQWWTYYSDVPSPINGM